MQQITEKPTKIFGIGLSKTGTSSLARALEYLGYRTKDNMGVQKYAAGDITSVDLDIVDAYDALTDTPIPSFYRELDARYPSSRFILTIRDKAGWLKSCRKQFTLKHLDQQNDAHRRLFRDLYETGAFDEERFSSRYDRFVQGVVDYFRTRPEKLLVMDIAAGDGWEQLCPFLGMPIPDHPFPKANVTEIRWIPIEKLAAIARGAGVELLEGLAAHGIHADGSRSDRSPPAVVPNPARVLAYALRSIRPNRTRSFDRLVRGAHDHIFRELNKLAPTIPVLSPFTVQVAHEIRAQWNHFWLVGLTDASLESIAVGSQLYVSLALVEDGQPIYGVVYLPRIDTLYFGRKGKGSFRSVSGKEMEKLPATSTSAHVVPRMASHAAEMCRAAESQAGSWRIEVPVREWDIAAAQVIAQCAGKKVATIGTSCDPVYNSPDLQVRGLAIEHE